MALQSIQRSGKKIPHPVPQAPRLPLMLAANERFPSTGSLERAQRMGHRALALSGSADSAIQRHSGSAAKDLPIGRQISASDDPAAIQRKLYVRALTQTTDESLNYEKTSLERKSAGETGNLTEDPGWGERGLDINSWLSGKGKLCTSRYVPGLKKYYSPVGYVVDIKKDEKVLANFTGDGNTNELQANKSAHWLACNSLRAKLRNNEAYEIYSDLGPGTLKTKLGIAIDNQPKATAFLRALGAHIQSEACDRAQKAKITAAMNDTARTTLTDFYQSGDYARRGVGGGLNPNATSNELGQTITEFEKNIRTAENQVYKFTPQGSQDEKEYKYTESVVNAGLADVKYVFFNSERLDFPGVVPAAWRTDDNWLANRKAAAAAIKAKLGGTLQVLTAKGNLADTSILGSILRYGAGGAVAGGVGGSFFPAVGTTLGAIGGGVLGGLAGATKWALS